MINKLITKIFLDFFTAFFIVQFKFIIINYENNMFTFCLDFLNTRTVYSVFLIKPIFLVLYTYPEFTNQFL